MSLVLHGSEFSILLPRCYSANIGARFTQVLMPFASLHCVFALAALRYFWVLASQARVNKLLWLVGRRKLLKVLRSLRAQFYLLSATSPAHQKALLLVLG